MREHTFFKFDPHRDRWPDLLPGDCFVAPFARLWRMDDYDQRSEEKVHPVSTRQNPMLVLARIDNAVGDAFADVDTMGSESGKLSTIVVFSVSKGFLIATVRLG